MSIHETSRLLSTLTSLQTQVRLQEATVCELRLSVPHIHSEPSTDPVAFYRQLCSLKAAYQSLTNSQLYLPAGDSLLPDLLALRIVSRTIGETNCAINQYEASLLSKERRLEKEKADLEGSKLIQVELRARISSLRKEIESNLQKSSRDLKREKYHEIERKKNYYDNETSTMVSALYKFIDNHLAPMLVIEDLGGPIVSQIVDINDEVFNCELSTYRKVKKAKQNLSKRQKTLSQIWDINSSNKEEQNEKSAASNQMKELIKRLLNNIIVADSDDSGAYVKLGGESAAARFLVRSKVAQFHPRDASRLRFIGFGGDLSD